MPTSAVLERPITKPKNNDGFLADVVYEPLSLKLLTAHDVGMSSSRVIVRAPVAKLGRWIHDVYGEVSFTQADFDKIILNYSAKKLGFEPTLTIGHYVDSSFVGGAPAVGFLVNLFQQEEVLWGDFEMVDLSVYEAIKLGRFRYASSEVVWHFTDRDTGEDISPVLIGLALTNQPFLPDLPRVMALSANSNGKRFFLSLKSMEPTMSTTSAETPKVEAPQVVSKPGASDAPAADNSLQIQLLSDNFTAQLAALKQEFQAETQKLSMRAQQAEEALQEAQAQLKKERVNRRLAELDTMNLSASVKDKYRPLIESESLGANEQAVFDALWEMSSQVAKVTTEQFGLSSQDSKQAYSIAKEAAASTAGSTTAETEADAENPYSPIIRRNIQLSQQLTQQRQMALFK